MDEQPHLLGRGARGLDVAQHGLGGGEKDGAVGGPRRGLRAGPRLPVASSPAAKAAVPLATAYRWGPPGVEGDGAVGPGDGVWLPDRAR